MPTVSSNPETSAEESADAITKANEDLNDQGDIAADDAGGTAIGHRVQEAVDQTPRAPD